ncbi:MAG TPA: endopeptidase La [Elusimicrobia bacterium]|nr:MAG: endopeptidase La [Elusimicrobia bacterium GWA2_66_18]HAZ08027.1 endopeptidase La [Elusimicrobiota bacterium]
MSDPRKAPARLPLLAVRDVVVFPHMVLPLSVGRPKSVKAIETAMQKHDKLLVVVAQKDVAVEDPMQDDVYRMGVLVEVVQYLKMPDGTLKVFLQGLRRAALGEMEFSAAAGHWSAPLSYPEDPVKLTSEIKAMMRHTLDICEEHGKLTRRSPAELAALPQVEDPSELADKAASVVVVKAADRQSLLELTDPKARLEKLVVLVKADIEILNLERKIHSRVKSQIEKTQKEYYLNEQMKAIQKELRQKDEFAVEIEELRKAVKDAKMPETAEAAAMKEVARLEKMMPFSPESTVSRTYLDWMTHLPWSKRTRDVIDLEKAQKILDEDHSGLPKAKERVLEYLAVTKLTKGLRGPILCFVGPPGVGKTSLGKSIARALGRKFVRMSLGGVRDEAEIRGHRRTYIGSLPGRLIQNLRKAGTRNPVILLDEVDKMGMDWRGDPSAALLEVLDPEQNSTFMDHYIDIEFDLSQVMFICTANELDAVPGTLRDRLEIVRFGGYTPAEKKAIALSHLLPKALEAHGLKKGQFEISDAALDRVIEEYTREAGVRHLEREISALCRKAARRVLAEKAEKVQVGETDIPKMLGPSKFPRERNSHNTVGVSTGLAWTETGGSTLAIEAVSVHGRGEVKITGRLGSVMTESAQTALSHVKSVAHELGIPLEAFRRRDFHLHFPEGAVPKDGPSAGIAIATALASLLSGRRVVDLLAMTGEITLRGRVLGIGGLKEKVLAADREGIKTILFPDSNMGDLEEIPVEVRERVKLVPVKHFREVAALALAAASEPLAAGKPVWIAPGAPSAAPSPPRPS